MRKKPSSARPRALSAPSQEAPEPQGHHSAHLEAHLASRLQTHNLEGSRNHHSLFLLEKERGLRDLERGTDREEGWLGQASQPVLFSQGSNNVGNCRTSPTPAIGILSRELGPAHLVIGWWDPIKHLEALQSSLAPLGLVGQHASHCPPEDAAGGSEVVGARGGVGVHPLAEKIQVFQLISVEIARNVDALTAHDHNHPACPSAIFGSRLGKP